MNSPVTPALLLRRRSFTPRPAEYAYPRARRAVYAFLAGVAVLALTGHLVVAIGLLYGVGLFGSVVVCRADAREAKEQARDARRSNVISGPWRAR